MLPQAHSIQQDLRGGAHPEGTRGGEAALHASGRVRDRV